MHPLLFDAAHTSRSARQSFTCAGSGLRIHPNELNPGAGRGTCFLVADAP